MFLGFLGFFFFFLLVLLEFWEFRVLFLDSWSLVWSWGLLVLLSWRADFILWSLWVLSFLLGACFSTLVLGFFG